MEEKVLTAKYGGASNRTVLVPKFFSRANSWWGTNWTNIDTNAAFDGDKMAVEFLLRRDSSADSVPIVDRVDASMAVFDDARRVVASTKCKSFVATIAGDSCHLSMQFDRWRVEPCRFCNQRRCECRWRKQWWPSPVNDVAAGRAPKGQLSLTADLYVRRRHDLNKSFG